MASAVSVHAPGTRRSTLFGRSVRTAPGHITETFSREPLSSSRRISASMTAPALVTPYGPRPHSGITPPIDEVIKICSGCPWVRIRGKHACRPWTTPMILRSQGSRQYSEGVASIDLPRRAVPAFSPRNPIGPQSVSTRRAASRHAASSVRPGDQDLPTRIRKPRSPLMKFPRQALRRTREFQRHAALCEFGE